jgi:hypothetical protein
MVGRLRRFWGLRPLTACDDFDKPFFGDDLSRPFLGDDLGKGDIIPQSRHFPQLPLTNAASCNSKRRCCPPAQ